MSVPRVLIDHGVGDCTVVFSVPDAVIAEREARERWLGELETLWQRYYGAHCTALWSSHNALREMEARAGQGSLCASGASTESDCGSLARGDHLPRQAVEDWCKRQPGVVSYEIDWTPENDGDLWRVDITLHEREGIRRFGHTSDAWGWANTPIEEIVSRCLEPGRDRAKPRRREGLARFSDQMIRGIA